MALTFMTGYAGQVRTKEQLETWSGWLRIEPEMRRRLMGMMTAVASTNRPIGIGGSWRSSDQQRTLFLSRYHLEDDSDLSGSIFWNGQYWEKNPGVAPAAPPGLSYHEPCTPEGFCLAVDMVGDVAFMGTIAGNYGLKHFGNINGEPWHLQPAELPNSRRNFTSSMVPLKVFGGSPVPPPPAPPKPIVVVPKPTLRYVTPINMHGPEVAKLQQIMGFWGWYGYKDASGKFVKYTADGWFGPRTLEAVKKMQKDLNTVADGIYGPITAAKYKVFAETMANIAAGN